MNKHRILYIIGSLEVGGAERHLIEVTLQLKKRGWDPEVFILTRGKTLMSQLTEKGIVVHGVTAPKWLDAILCKQRLRNLTTLLCNSFFLIYILWRKRPKITHYFLPVSYIVGGIASLFTPTSIRIMSRRSLNHYQTHYKILAYLEHWLHRRTTYICGNSKAVLRDLEEEGVSKQQLRLIYNGKEIPNVQESIPRKQERRRLNVDPDALIFIIVANLIPYKGHRDLITAFSHINHHLPKPWCLLCLGRDDGLKSELQAQAAQAGIVSYIHFLGVCDHVAEFLRIADIGVLCSHEEGFSNAVLECMAAGLPMVVTDVGGNREAVLDGETGYICPPKQPQQLAQALLKMATQANLNEMGMKGRKHVETMFNMKTCMDGYEQLYHDALELIET